MVHVGGKTLLLLRTEGRAAGRRTGLPGLEFGAFTGLPAPVPVQPSALVVGAVGGSGEVDDPAVHTDPVHRLEHLRIGEVAGGDQEPLPAPPDQVGLALAVLGQRLELVRRSGVADAWSLPLEDRVLLVAAYWRTNLTLRQLAPLFGVSKSAADRIIDHLGRALALQQRKRFRKDAVLIVDGTLVPTRDHQVAVPQRLQGVGAVRRERRQPAPPDSDMDTPYSTSTR
jgi:hypothetical protein